jgi:endonuclease YncB( thermonuclease family)
MTDYKYTAQVLRVVDGDTLEVELEILPGMTYQTKIRLLGVDTHETYGTKEESREHQRGERETEFVESWIAGTEKVRVRLHGEGKYGRQLAEVSDEDGTVLNERILRKFDDVAY